VCGLEKLEEKRVGVIGERRENLLRTVVPPLP